MAFRAGAGRIVVTDATDLVTVFDSDEGLFSATDFVTGQVTTPARQAFFNGSGGGTNFPFDTDTDHVIGSVNAFADVCVGGFKVTVSTPIGLADLGWYNASGSYMHYIDSTSAASQAGTGEHWFLTNMATYTFKCASGTLYLNERVQLQAQSTLASVLNTTTLLAVTFDFKLYCGRFV